MKVNKKKERKLQQINTHKDVVPSPEWILENGLRASRSKNKQI
jgi:hypothetical protein